MKKWLSLSLGLLLAACAALPTIKPTSYQAKNAVILVIDGPRQSEMWEDKDRKHIPHLANDLAPQGVLLSKFRNNGPTYTAAGHTAFCTGFYEEMENSKGKQLPSHAGIFQHYLKASQLPKSKAWVITTKDKLVVLANTTESGWQDKYMPMAWCGKNGKGAGAGYGEDAETFPVIKETLARDHPHLVLINLKQPDSGGHSGKWENYIEGLKASDAYALELWNFLQADSEYRDKTALFITHDHGRHLDGVADGFVNHGDNCEGCRKVSLLALGPDFKKGAVLENQSEQIDLPVTIADLLGFEMPGLKGRVLSELYAK